MFGVIASIAILMAAEAARSRAHEPKFPVLFVLSLLMQGGGIITYLGRGQYVRVAIGVVLAASCIVYACMPWYGEHPDFSGRSRHGHSIWELGHIH